MNHKKIQVWECKIVVPDGDLPDGFDTPPRMAVIKAIEDAGIEVLGCSSGWGGALTKIEQEAYECQVDDVYIAGLTDSGSDTKH
jgi:hypothetical protein